MCRGSISKSQREERHIANTLIDLNFLISSEQRRFFLSRKKQNSFVFVSTVQIPPFSAGNGSIKVTRREVQLVKNVTDSAAAFG
jgi:hypothetical protein